MAEKDIISKRLLKLMAADMATVLFGLDIAEQPVEILETQEQRVEERRADLVARMRLKAEKHPFILHVEIQNDNQVDFPLRMLRYYTDIALAYPRMPVKQYAIYIGKAKLNLEDYIENEAWRYEYHLLDMRKIDCGVLIRRNTPESLVLAILCDFKDRPKQDVVNFIVKRLHDIFEDNEKEFHSYLKMLEVYSKNRDLKQAVKEAENMLTRYDETTLPSYELGWEAAERKYQAQEEQVKKQAREQARYEFAQILLLESKHSLEEISRFSKLPLEQVKQMADKIANKNKQEH